MILVQYNADVDEPEGPDLVPIGILANVRDVVRAPHVGVQMLVELQRRVRFVEITSSDPFLAGIYAELEDGSDTIAPRHDHVDQRDIG